MSVAEQEAHLIARDLWFSEFEKNCPLRKLLKWKDAGDRRTVLFHTTPVARKHWCEVAERNGSIRAGGEGDTSLKAAEGAVRQLESRGEL